MSLTDGRETIIVTGGAGYIGSHTVVALLEAGYDVAVVDDLSNSTEAAVSAAERIAGRTVRFYRADVRDAAALERIFSDCRPSGVIHFAGLKAVAVSVREPLKYYRNNIYCLLTLLAAMDAHGVKRLIFSSSATVYGFGEPPFREDAATGGCTSPYGWTKYMAEQIIRDWARATDGASAALLRYFNPVGAHDSGLLGEAPLDVPNNLMPLIQEAVFKGRMLRVFGGDYPTADGTCIRDYIHVMDLAEGHIAALRYTESRRGAEAINLGVGRGFSVLELLRAYEAANGVTVPHVMADRRAGDVAASFADTEKAARLLNWRATRSVEDMCRSAYSFRANAESTAVKD